MNKEIIINATNEETRIAIREDGQLVELFVERPENQRMVGDIYKGKVSRVLPGMQAAFISIGMEQNAFLHFSDVSDATPQFLADLDEKEEEENNSTYKFDAAKDLKNIKEIVVQIMKEPIGGKGSRVTSQISIPGRFAVLMPNQRSIGVSRKISNFKEKRRLRNIARRVLPKNFGLIVRTVAEGKSDKEIAQDITTLLKIWETIEQRIQESKAPALVYKDMGMATSIMRDLFTADVTRVVVDSRKLMREISAYVKHVAPALRHKIEYHKQHKPIFDHFGIEEELRKSMQSKVWLKNGACIVIEPTEALVSVDVNSGKFIGKKDHETNSLKINMEAAREIARQARLRDLGGLIIIDFIDVQQPENKRKIYMELKKEFYKDRSITKIEELSRFGLIEMTRQRIRPSILNAISEECPRCQGSGLIPSLPSVIADIERLIQRYRSERGDRRITLRLPPEIYDYLNRGRFSRRLQLMWKYWMKLSLYKDPSLNNRQFKVFDKKNEQEIVIN